MTEFLGTHVAHRALWSSHRLWTRQWSTGDVLSNRRKPTYSEQSLPECYSVNHKSHIRVNCLGLPEVRQGHTTLSVRPGTVGVHAHFLKEREGKAVPVTGPEDPCGCETSQMAVRLSCAGRPLPPGRFLVLISVRG
jgi:hypothetical protein